MLYIASVDETDDVFYKKEATDDVKLLCSNIRIIDFEDQWYHLITTYPYRTDLQTHFEVLKKGEDTYTSGYAVGSKCINYNPGVIQAMSYLSWSAIYWYALTYPHLPD